MGRGGKKGKKSKKSSKPKTKAQKMAVANKAKYGGTASAAKANKAAGKAKAKAKFTASQAAKKSTPSTGKSISKGTTGIGPVKSGATYSKAVSKATNAPTKKTSGVGPVVSGKEYAAALKASPPKLKDGTKVAGNYTSPNVTGYGLRPDGVTGPYKTGDVFNTGGTSGKDFKYDGKSFVPVKTAMLPGDNMGGPAAVIGGLGTMTIMGANAIKNTIQNLAPKFKEKMEQRVNPDADKLSFAGDIGGLGIGTGAPSYFSIKSPESFGAPSQADVDAAAGITAGGLNIGGSGFTPSNPSGGANARAIFPGASPNSVLNDPNFTPGPVAGDPFAQPGPGGPEPEADYTSYQPGSFYNQSDTNMNPTNFLRSTRNVVTTPFRALGINNRLTNMLIPKSNEAIQDARDQRGPRPTLTRRGGGGGARLPVAPLTPEEILLPEVGRIDDSGMGPDYQQIEGQTGVDPNRLMQIQQEAYARAFNPYNPLTVGGFNPFFRFFDRRAGQRRGAFRRAFRRD